MKNEIANYLNHVEISITPCKPSDTNDLPETPGHAVIGLASASGGVVAFTTFGESAARGSIDLRPGIPVLVGAKRVLATGTEATQLSVIRAVHKLPFESV